MTNHPNRNKRPYRVIRNTRGIDGKYFVDGASLSFESEDEAREYANLRALDLGRCYMGASYLAIYHRRTFLAEYRIVPNGAPRIVGAFT